MSREYLSGVALVKKSGNDIKVLSTPSGVGDSTQVSAEGTGVYKPLSQWMKDLEDLKAKVAELEGKSQS